MMRMHHAHHGLAHVWLKVRSASMMPKAPQVRPNEVDSDVLDRCIDDIMYWGEIVTVNAHVAYVHIKPFPGQAHHPEGNVFAHFYENPMLEGLSFQSGCVSVR